MLRKVLSFLKEYVSAVFLCFYLFSLGFLSARNRTLIQDICFHFRHNRFKNKDESAGPPEILDPELEESLNSFQFARYYMYADIMRFVRKNLDKKDRSGLRAIEFGGGNGIIKRIFNCPGYEIAENFPKVDILNLSRFRQEYYDFVVIDQVLEHVLDPAKGLEEIYRILKTGGWLIATTPFLVKIHNHPEDYWRFSVKGMEILMSRFSEVIVRSWGNKETVLEHIKTGRFASVDETKKLGLFNLTNDESCPHVVWCFSRK